MKCRECGNELLTGDRYWQMGLCNECWSAYRFFNKSIPLDNPYEKRIEELQKQLAEKDKEIEEYKTEQLKFAGKVAKLVDKEVAETRHQVCEEIREKAFYVPLCRDIESNICYCNNYVINKGILDQIEKGEEVNESNKT